MPGANLLQGLCGHFDLVPVFRVGEVHDLEQEVGVADLLKSGPESLDQGVGKVLHEADRVSKQKGQVAGRVDPADGGIQRREQHVCLEDPFVLRLHIIRRGCFFQEIRIRELKTDGLSCSAAVIQEGVHNGRLARIGVADQGDPGETGPKAPAPLRGTLAVHDL